MKPTSKKLVLRISAGLVVAGSAFYVLQQVGSLMSVPENLTQEQLKNQFVLAESLYSRNLQAIDLADAVSEASAEKRFIAAANLWKSSLRTSNEEIEKWLQEKRVTSSNVTTFSKELNIQEGLLRNARESLNERSLAEAVDLLVLNTLDVRKVFEFESGKLDPVIDSVLAADARMQAVATLIIEGN